MRDTSGPTCTTRPAPWSASRRHGRCHSGRRSIFEPALLARQIAHAAVGKRTLIHIFIVDILVDRGDEVVARAHGCTIEEYEDDLDIGMRIEKAGCLLAHDGECPGRGKSVDTGGDEWERHRVRPELEHAREDAPVAGVQRLVFSGAAAMPDGSHRMDAPRCGQRKRRRHHRAARGTAAEVLARTAHLVMPRGGKDRTAYATAKHQMRVGSVHHAVCLHARDIVSHDGKRHDGPSNQDGDRSKLVSPDAPAPRA